MRKQERLTVLRNARDASARGDHSTARALFASLGIDYLTAAQVAAAFPTN